MTDERATRALAELLEARSLLLRALALLPSDSARSLQLSAEIFAFFVRDDR